MVYIKVCLNVCNIHHFELMTESVRYIDKVMTIVAYERAVTDTQLSTHLMCEIYKKRPASNQCCF